MTNEIWTDVIGYEGLYEVSNLGQVRNAVNKRILKPHLRGLYRHIVLVKPGQKRKNFSIHRLVAMAFLPNPNNLPVINHKDENPLNNSVDNLEWCTQRYNMDYSHVHEKSYKRTRKPVLMFNMNGQFEKEFAGLREASRFIGIEYTDIRLCCNGKHKTCGGHIFRFKNEEGIYNVEPVKPKTRAVLQCDEDGNIIHRYNSIHEAARAVGAHNQNINDCCQKKQYHCKGFRWYYAD